MMRIAVIGDVHEYWDETDNRYFNAADVDCVLFVGDLARVAGGTEVARQLSALRRRTVVIPGNHDACVPLQLFAEMAHRPAARRLSRGHEQRIQSIDDALGDAELGGYRLHHFPELDIVTARPHAMGGDRLYFADYLARRFDVHSMAQSAARLRRLVDQAGDTLLFLAHNGPSGLGDAAQAIWGCDFNPELGDFGDPDLRDAVDYALSTGRQVRAVVAGHMHHRTVQGMRTWWRRVDNVLYVNAACVPRITEETGSGRRRHHVRLDIDGDDISLCEVWVDDGLREIRLPAD